MESEDEDAVITSLSFAAGKWYGKFAVDEKLWEIDVTSLHADFMAEAIVKAKRNPGMLVQIPKGKAGYCAVRQLQCNPSFEPGCVPVNLYNAMAFCQRNGLLLAFRKQLTDTQIQSLVQNTTAGMLDESFADQIRHNLSITAIRMGDIKTKAEFYSRFSCGKIAWQFSPVRADGYAGHSVVVTRGVWYDSAHQNAKTGTGIGIGIPNWHLSLPYDWDWQCTDVRQLVFKTDHGVVCGCGIRINRQADAETHHLTKKHQKWSRWLGIRNICQC